MSVREAADSLSVVIAFLNIALVLVLITAIGIIIWRVISVRRFPYFLCLFLIKPIGLLLMLYSFSFSGWTVYWLIGLLFGLAANILLLMYTISQEKKTTALEELSETRHMMELEKSYYEAALERTEELDKIRRDFNEKLEAVAKLTRAGEDSNALNSIWALAEKIDLTRENPYCAIPVINAVLTEKQKECEKAGILLSVELNLPDALAVEPMHLCSILGNILDNAITACLNVRSDDKPAYIRLSTIMDGDYLIIKAVNPSAQPKKTAPGRGYGTRILAELAGRYEGNYISEYDSGSGAYTVLMSLMAKGDR